MFTRRIFLGLAVAAALATPAFAQSFPVTVEHIYGTTTIPAAPLRVVSVGMHEQDFLYSLGVAPVGVKEWWGDHPYATWPWAEEARLALGAEPEVMKTDGVNLEWVLAQDPDLIIGIYVTMDEALYGELSKIAPTVVTPAGYAAWGAPWQAELTIIDQATSGNTQKSDAIIAEFDARYAAVRAEFPQLAGKTGTNVYVNEDGGFTAWGSGDLASKFLIDLGLSFPPELDALADADNRILISEENLRLLDMDVAIWPVDADTGEQAKVEAMPLYQNLNLAKEGRSVWLDDGKGLAYAAMSWQTPLSLGYLLDILPPALAAAADGDLATVPSIPKQ
jgi:iron complex transport system substrate-binding protein